ncbi:ribosomal protein S18-alanine N-acetyltransferase [Clostridium tarantellae]|uniref:[Ribosomal protein bS18]-alanine N-acetyltransferase n=1 Tax=Clostridium tarantellae TaxID=39493 RepID=A0A6I1MRN7_9CLOT|nr:ribosomal protein S18-alanine N-acetyltransferase [Clostridium tarantellae]MPQ43561.1 ribosomal-protein-alanine N-acetyltransferase [Clostridium tarantellae]
MDFSIKSMTLECINDVIEISNLSFPVAWSETSFLNEIKNPLAHYLVAKAGEKVIGFIGAWSIIDEAHITNIAVHPNYRKQGVGDLLIEGLFCLSNELNLIALTLEVRASNIPAQNLYKKHGFVEEGIRKKYYEDNNEDAIIMWKR